MNGKRTREEATTRSAPDGRLLIGIYRGTCHKCGAKLSRGRVDNVRLCASCGTRCHATDCGKRLRDAGYPVSDRCPKVLYPQPSRTHVLVEENDFAR